MKSHKMISRMIAFLLMFIMVYVLSACGNTRNVQGIDVQRSEEQTADVSEIETDENTGARPSDVSNITEQAGVPLLTLNNRVQMPQLGLGTQIQK